MNSNIPEHSPFENNSGGNISQDENNARIWTMAMHLSALCLCLGLPFGNILAPLLIWIFKKDDHTLVNRHGPEVLNFQISFSIYFIVAGLAIFILIGFILVPVVAIIWFVVIIIAAVKAYNGEDYSYPLTIKFIN